MKEISLDNSIYIKAQALAEIKNVSVRAIRLSCERGKYQFRYVSGIGRGGKQYEILVSSLEPEVQEKILHIQSMEKIGLVDDNGGNFALITQHTQAPFSLAFTPNRPSNGAEAPITSVPFSSTDMIADNDAHNLLVTFGLNKFKQDNRVIPDSAKEKALAKIDLIVYWQDFRAKRKDKSIADIEFFKLYNSKLISENLYNKLGKCSKQSLYRWNKEWVENNKDWRVLIDAYNYGSESSLKTTLNDFEKYALLRFMLNQNKFKLATAYEHIKRTLESKGITNISSLAAYRRVWQYVCKNYSEAVEIARGGMKAALDNKLPHIIRDNKLIKVGEVIVGDGHTLDFMVKNPETGKPCRATLVGFLDWASRDLVGYDIKLTENTQVIASALRNAIINLGQVPKVVYLDNGRAFKGKTFTGCADFSAEGIQGLYAKLGIETKFAKPYNGREKTIERFFRDLTDSCAKSVSTYIGNNISNKPAYTQRNEKFHNQLKGDFVPTIQEAREIIENWLNDIYRKRAALNDKTRTIAEFVAENKGSGINIDDLDDLMMCSKPHKLGRNGVKLFGEYYYAPELTGLDIKVIAKYSMFDLSFVKVYSTRGEYICKAERVTRVHPLAEVLGSPKDLAEYLEQQKKVKKVVKDRIDTTKKALKSMYKDTYCSQVTHTQCKSLRKSCYPEFISGSNQPEIGLSSGKMLKQVQHDIKRVHSLLPRCL